MGATSRRVDENDRVFWTAYAPPLAGEVFVPHLIENFIGNGNGNTVRTAALSEVGGYFFTRDGRPFEIAEDWLMQMRIAHRYRITHVPGFLVGYRPCRGARSETACAGATGTPWPCVRSSRARRVYRASCSGFPRRVPAAVCLGTRPCPARKRSQSHIPVRNPLVPFYMAYVFIERVAWKLFPRLRPSSQISFVPEAQRRGLFETDPMETPARYAAVSTRLTFAIYRWLGHRDALLGRRVRYPYQWVTRRSDVASC